MSNLLDLRRLVRIGGSAHTTRLFPPGIALRDRIGILADQLQRDGVLADPGSDKLQYLTLMAEFEYAFGLDRRDAATELAKEVAPLRDRLVECIKQKRKKFGEGSDTARLRQEVWALAAHEFYGRYCAGDLHWPIKTLKALKRVVQEELVPAVNRQRRQTTARSESLDKYEAHGTLARLCEFLGQCLRTTRRFDEARAEFLEGIEHTQARLQEKRGAGGDIAAEQAFATISIARLLGGLGRLAILRGQLSEALQLLRSARTILESVDNDQLKSVIDSQILVAERRRLMPGTKGWRQQLAALVALHKGFTETKDLDGQRRCCNELAQAQIEYAELSVPPKKHTALSAAEHWINALEKVSKKTDDIGGQAGLFRTNVLRTFHALLSHEGTGENAGSPLADKPLRAAATMVGPCRFDVAGCDCIDISLPRGLVLLIESRRKAIQHFREVRRSAMRVADRELEVEATIRLAQAEFIDGNSEAAGAYLRRCTRIGHGIENGFLLALLKETVQVVRSRPVFKFPLDGWDSDVARAKADYLDWALKAGKTVPGAASLLRINKNRLEKYIKSHRHLMNNKGT